MADESYDPHARMHESFPRVDSGSAEDVIDRRPTWSSVNVAAKGDSERKSIRDRYGDNRSDLPNSAEDNEYNYNAVRQ